MKGENALVVFGEELPRGWERDRRYSVVVASEKLRQSVEVAGVPFVPMESFIKDGSIYEARALFEDLSYLRHAECRIAKSFLYKKYELWWIHSDSLYSYFCLPYTQYKDLLGYIKDFKSVYLYCPSYQNLFAYYLQAYGITTHTLSEQDLKSPSFLPFGVFFQMCITLISLLVLAMRRRPYMVYIGDKFEKSKDYDFRMGFVYEELRQRKVPFVEFIRSLEPWRVVLQHAYIRGRPVVYSEAVAFTGRCLSILSGGRRRAKQKSGVHTLVSETDPEKRFKLLVASHYLRTIYDDIWAIRIMKWILHVIGVKAAFFSAATERNFHSVLGCKLNRIPTVGIMHATASRHYNMYDFMPGFDGEKSLSVDRYGVWSAWWKAYYLKNSRAYRLEQLYVSGPMRPLRRAQAPIVRVAPAQSDPLKALFIAEQLGVPTEAMPYLVALLDAGDVSVYVKFRPYRDGLEEWMKEHRPDILERIDSARIFRGGMQEAIAACDVAVGSHSTAVLEALLQLKPPLFYVTGKWGDYFDLGSFDAPYSFIADTPQKFLASIRESRNIPSEILKELRERFFGDPYQNGSAWVVDQLECELLKGCITR